MDQSESSRPRVPPGTTFWQWIAYYFSSLVEDHHCHNETDLARTAGIERGKLRGLLKKTNQRFKSTLVQEKPPAPGKAVPSTSPAPTSTARLAPEAAPDLVAPQYLTPEVRAKLEAMQTARRKQSGGNGAI